MRKIKLLLASQSPRRRELLNFLLKPFQTKSFDFNEPAWQRGQNPTIFMKTCLQSKWDQALAAAGSQPARSATHLLVADTIVLHRGTVLGKPCSKAEARFFLEQLSGEKHRVLTGYRLGEYRNGAQAKQRLCWSEVTFYKLSKVEIQSYMRTGDGLDKAGGYGFQGQALPFVKSIKGSYYSVMGLPLEILRNDLKRMGFIQ